MGARTHKKKETDGVEKTSSDSDEYATAEEPSDDEHVGSLEAALAAWGLATTASRDGTPWSTPDGSVSGACASLRTEMWHVRIDTAPWGPDASLRRLDDTLRHLGSTCLSLDMSRIPLESDGDHFTRAGQLAFHAALCEALRRRPLVGRLPVLVLSDSTIDHHNWTPDGEWTGWASSHLTEALAASGHAGAVVDAVRGSGFLSRAREGEHFYARLSHHLRAGHRGPVVFVGGWNDARTGRPDETMAAMRKCASTIERYDSL